MRGKPKPAPPPLEDGSVVKHSIEKDEGHKAVFAGILLTLKSFSAKCG